ncbi:RNA-guided endonuclease InsQ/TnpB family protein [Streptomyces netropsis]
MHRPAVHPRPADKPPAHNRARRGRSRLPAPCRTVGPPLNPADPHSNNIAAAKPYHTAARQLLHAYRALSRTRRGSKNRRKAARKVGKLHHQIARRRQSYLHQASKRLATHAAAIAIEDLDLPRLTASGKGTLQAPGTNVKVKALFNRHLLDTGLGELRRQLTYKTRWYGSTLVILDRGEPTSTKCSRCDERNPSSKPSDKRFHCAQCGHDTSRRDNAVRNIHKAARKKLTVSVAPGTGETQNASRGRDKPHPGDRKGPPPTTETPPPLTG